MSENKINFEKELNRLKEIVNQIQDDELSVDDSLKLYEEGHKIIVLLTEELNKAEAKVEQVINVNK